MREGVLLFDAEQGGTQVGQVTSGGFGPSVGHPVAMGYVDAAFAELIPRCGARSGASACRSGSRRSTLTPLRFKR